MCDSRTSFPEVFLLWTDYRSTIVVMKISVAKYFPVCAYSYSNYYFLILVINGCVNSFACSNTVVFITVIIGFIVHSIHYNVLCGNTQ